MDELQKLTVLAKSMDNSLENLPYLEISIESWLMVRSAIDKAIEKIKKEGLEHRFSEGGLFNDKNI